MKDTVEYAVHFRNAGAGRRKLTKTEARPAPKGKVPRIAKLMALAIHFDQLIRERKVRDQAELAELGGVTRARVTQIMNLLCLTPDIQEELLFLSLPTRGRGVVSERDVRPIAATVCWEEQRQVWRRSVNASHLT